jgi:hypothetical protein
MKALLTYLVMLGLLIAWGCKDPFMPDLSASQKNVLVVEGYINVGANAVTSIKLSRTTPVNEANIIDQETGAQLSIQTEDGDEYFLTEKKKGEYASAPLNLSLDGKYRLAIRTSEGSVYYSTFVSALVTPKIDSVSWELTPKGIAIYVTTHDTQKNTTYYQWEYEETWSTPSRFQSFYIYENSQLKKRPPEDRIIMRRCWKYNSSPELMIASTASQEEDAIRMKLLTFLPIHGERLDDKYSILVKQHVLSKEAFEYLDILQKNSTDVGSFTDPQPSQLFGNISSSDSDQMVVGLMQAYTTEQVRLYIEASEVPTWRFDLGCQNVFVMNNPDTLIKYFEVMGYIPTNEAEADSPDVYAAKAVCVDCRLRGGSTTQPDFWE